MFGRITRSMVLALGVFVAFMLAAAPAFASGTAGQGVQYPGIGVGNWQPIGSQPLEFDLAYAGNDVGAEIQVASNPASRVGFNVYTDFQWKQLAAGNSSVTPVGKGTPNPTAGNNLTWKASQAPGELYHVQVYLIGTQPAAFWINQQGCGNCVLFAVSPLSAQPQPQAAAPAPAPAPSPVKCVVPMRWWCWAR